MLRKILLALLSLFLLAFLYFRFTLYPQIPIGNGYAAKKMCSCTFIAGRSQESIQEKDLSFGPLSMTKTFIDHSDQSATTTLLGLKPRTAVYREGVGCILLKGKDDYNINITLERPTLSDTLNWPLGNQTASTPIPSEVNASILQAAIDGAFDPSGGMDSVKTRAIVVVHKGQLIAEKYAPGFGPDTEILGWSMTKSITATLLGILAKQGTLQLDDKALFPEWDDDRKEISLRHLLNMQSGLEFSEVYDKLSDANRMLFQTNAVAEIPKSKALLHEPGTHWSYSSGTTNLLSDYLRNQRGDREAYLRFPYDSLFHRIGMTSAVMETDESGTYIGSSFCYATPRDWARFGLLYLNEGNWFGDQVIDTTWVDFAKTLVPDSDGIYGGQFWLNADHSAYPDVPSDLFSCNGF
ncbi:MAG: serine hydrolase, partial [Bacteroidota bacterium]